MEVEGMMKSVEDVMRQNFEDVNLTLHNADNFRFISDGSVDLVLTDPPFNIARETNFHTYEKNTVNSFKFDAGKGWDSHTPEEFRALLSAWSLEFFRVLRRGGSFAVFCADEYLSDLIFALREAGLKPRRTVTWRKPNAVPVNRKHLMMSSCEYIVVGVKGSNATFNADLEIDPDGAYSLSEIVNISDKISSVLDTAIRKALLTKKTRIGSSELESLVRNCVAEELTSAVSRSMKIYDSKLETAQLCIPNFVAFNSKGGNRLHPTEKPVDLLTYLIELLSNPGDLVLDPFFGSCSTGEACLRTGRGAHLVERDSEFFGKGLRRISVATEKLTSPLFDL